MRLRSLPAPLPLVLLALLAGAVPALGAGPGATFLTGGLDLPVGGIAGGPSGYTIFEADDVAVSDDGRYVAFSSNADLLDPAANPDTTNVYRKDRLTGAVVLVSRASGAAGAASAQLSYTPSISDDGRVVAFLSRAALDPADSDGNVADVYVRNLDTGVTTLASVGDGGAQTTSGISSIDLSGDGARVAFATEERLDPVDDTGINSDIYVRDLSAGRTALVSRRAGSSAAANGGSFVPAISDDGRWVAFVSSATDLVAGYVGGDTQAFVRDVGGAVAYVASNQAGLARTAGNGRVLSVDLAGAPDALARAVVAYDTSATNVAGGGVDGSSDSSVYVHDMSSGSSQLVSVSDAGVNADSRAHTPSISDDGRRVEFDSDADNLATDPVYYGVYLRDLGAGRTLLASADTFYSVQGSLSGNGAFVGWYSGHGLTPDADPDLGGVYGRPYAPPAMGATAFLSRPPGSAPFVAPAIAMEGAGAGSRTISADGRYIVFHAYSTSRLPGGVADRPGQIYRRDLATGAIDLVSRASGANGAPADGFSDLPTISADGTRVAFRTSAHFDPAHPASSEQLYVRDLVAGTTTLVSRAEGVNGSPSDESIGDPVIAPDGRHVVFLSSGDLGAGRGVNHVYLRDVPGGHTTLVDRASGASGAIANDDADQPSPSTDGRFVAFASRASNLDPADPAGILDDVYVRDTVAGTTALVSRRGGAAGQHATGSSDAAAISANGSVVAFTAEDETLAPEAGGWGGRTQVVARTLATGGNVLVSRVPGGAPADANAGEATVSGDGGVIAFESEATNLLPGRGGDLHPSVFARTSSSGALSGPPAFGFAGNPLGDYASRPAISDDGQCLAFRAHGHNAVTGVAGDFDTSYLYVVSGVCPKALPVVVPPARRLSRAPRPVLTRASLSHRRFRVGRGGTPQVLAGASATRRRARRRRPGRAPVGTAFRFALNTRANVAIAIERPAQGRLVGRFCRRPTRRLRHRLRCVRFVRVGTLTRGGVRAGRVSVAFSGRISRKALKPGSHRARLRASNGSGVSRWVRLSFTVVR